MGKSGIRSAYATGKGKIYVRAKTEIQERKDGTSSIIVTELPYQVNKKMLVESIAALVKDKKIDGLSDIDDHSSDRVGIRLEIFLKRDANPQVILNQLFKLTRLQDSFSVNMLAICDGKPKTMGLKEILARFIDFQVEIVTRRIKFDLKKAEARMHILEGLRIALANIDEIINIIRNSYDDAKERLMARFDMSEIQAQSVLDMRLGQLQRLNGEKIEEEYNELVKKAEEYRLLLSDHGKLMEQIKKELIEIRDKYGDERLTKIEPAVDFDIDDEDLIEREECVITMTHFGYIKRLPLDTYKAQHRGGRGISGLSTRDEDFVERIFTSSSHDYIMFFTNKGKVYKLKAYRIPETGRQAKGTAVVNLLPLEKDEYITASIPISKFSADSYLTMITRNGVVKKTSLEEYDTNRKGGIIAIGLRENDDLIEVSLTKKDDNIVIATRKGMCIKFKESDVRSMGRGATGVTGIRLKEDDYVVGASVCGDDCMLLSVTENGYGKKTDINEFKCQNRSGKGVTAYKITEKTGLIAGISVINEGDDLMAITSDGIIIRMSTDEISLFGRVTQGVRVMRLADDVRVVSIAKSEKIEEEDSKDKEESEEKVSE